MIYIHEYTICSIVVLGDTKPHAKALKSLGGRYNPHLSIDGEKVVGWVFKMGDKEKVETFIESGCKSLEERVLDLESRLKRIESSLDQA